MATYYSFMLKTFKAGIIANAVLGAIVGVLALFGFIHITL
jgi:hypothetical protein